MLKSEERGGPVILGTAMDGTVCNRMGMELHGAKRLEIASSEPLPTLRGKRRTWAVALSGAGKRSARNRRNVLPDSGFSVEGVGSWGQRRGEGGADPDLNQPPPHPAPADSEGGGWSAERQLRGISTGPRPSRLVLAIFSPPRGRSESLPGSRPPGEGVLSSGN